MIPSVYLRLFNFKIISEFQFRTLSNISLKPLIRNFESFSNNIAITDNLSKYKYSEILNCSHFIAKKMQEASPSLSQNDRQTVCFLCANDASYVSILLACWLNGNIAVPLCKEHPPSLHEYFLNDSKTSLVICTPPYLNQIQPLSNKLNIPLLKIEHPNNVNNKSSAYELNTQNLKDEDSGAVIIYTSGTTGPPKGVLLTHKNLCVQVHDIVKAWDWNSDVKMLNVLPLHHVHGFLYCLLSTMSVGGTVVMMPKFNPLEVWNYFTREHGKESEVNTFTAVPTVYTKLVNAYETFLKESSLNPNEVKNKCQTNIKLMASGSSALPDTVFHTWEKLTGHVILERYGMSEIGMALSNPLLGKRKAGTVGSALPGVQVRIAKSLPSQNEYETLVETINGKTKIYKEGESGDLQIKGPNVFKEYWMKPEATMDSFTSDGWFKTGDVAIFEDEAYRILGRASSDIIKTGGYKVSALDIERYLLEYPSISECTVFGVPHEEWGEAIVAVYALHPNKTATSSDLKEFLKTKLPSYSVPKIFQHIDSIPRNLTGKVNKKEFKKNFISKT